MHHRAIITGYSHSRTLGCEIASSTYDIGFPYNTDWKDCERVTNTVRDLEARGMRVTVETCDSF